MIYAKYACFTEVMWRGKKCTVRGIQHGHKDNRFAGNIYTLRFESGSRPQDYPNIPESEITPIENITYVSQGSSAFPVRHTNRPKLVKS